MAEKLFPGDPAPGFKLPDAAGNTVDLTDLLGSKVIVYFYPAATTPGCTREACDFQDNLASLGAHGYQVVGISPDTAPALRKFADNEGLTFPLLSDSDHAVSSAWGAWGEKKNYGRVYQGLIRSTVVVNDDGTVAAAQYNVRATGHVEKLRKDLRLF